MTRGSHTQESLTNSKHSSKSNSSKLRVFNPMTPLIPPSKSLIPLKMNVHEKIQTLENNIKTFMFSEDPKKKDFIWPLVQESAILNNSLAVKWIQKQKFDKAETYLLKAKQITEPLNSKYSRNWPKIKEWLLIRLALYQNFALIYKHQKQYQKAYDLLSDFAKILKIEDLVDRTEIIMAGAYETFYINLAYFSKKLEKYEESLIFAEKTIEFLQSLLRNNGLIKQISEEMKREKQGFEVFLTRKNALLASLFYMKGKILIKQGKEDLSIEFLNISYRLNSEYLGENHEKTMKYKAKYGNMRNKLAFLSEMGNNNDVKDFQAFKQEIEASNEEKAVISSISEIDEKEGSYMNSNIEQQPLQIKRSINKKTTANFYLPTNILTKKALNLNIEGNKSNNSYSLNRPKIMTLGLLEEKDQKFSDLLKNTRIIYPRTRSPMPKNLQMSFDVKNPESVFLRKKNRSSSKSKSPSPNQKNFSLISGFFNNSKKSSLLNSSSFYNKLRINSQKTKALYQATISRFFSKTDQNARFYHKTPEKIKPFLNKTLEKSKENAFIKEFPNLRSGEQTFLLKESRLQMIFNQRPQTPVNFYRKTPTPEIQITPVNNKHNNNETLPENTHIKINDEDYQETVNFEEGIMQKFIKRRPQKSVSHVKTPKNQIQTVTYSCESPKNAAFLAKRHTLTVNVLNFTKKTLNSTVNSMNKSKRFSMAESISQANLRETSNHTLNSPAIKTLASIAESYGKANNNESRVLSKNDSSIDSQFSIHINNKDNNIGNERKNSNYTGKMTLSDPFEEKQNSFLMNKPIIPRLSKDLSNFKKSNSKNQLTPQQKSHLDLGHQMTFQHVKYEELKRLKTMKSLDFNQNNNIKGSNNIPNTSITPKSVKKVNNKKSISFIRENTGQVLRATKTNEFSAGQSDDTFNNNNLNNDIKDIVGIPENILKEESPLLDINLANQMKTEKAVRFIQNTFRKILERKLNYVKHMMSDARYSNETNMKLANEIEGKISNLKIKEVISLLRGAKTTVHYLTFQEILALDQFPLRFYSNFLIGFGAKSVFWLLDRCILQEEFKLVLTDPNDINVNDEWRYHDSFLLILQLRNSINRDFRLEIRTKERLSIEKSKNKYIWKVNNLIIDEWLGKEGFMDFYRTFLKEREEKDLENKQILAFYRIHDKKMTESDKKELWGFRMRLIFLIEKAAILVRKPVGFSWRFQGFFKENPNYSNINTERACLLRERAIIRRYLACSIGRNLGIFLSKYGLEKIIRNEDPTTDIKLFYENFEPWLKENTFEILRNNGQRKLRGLFKTKA